MNIFIKFLYDESGQGLAEYSLILSLVAIAIVLVVSILGDNVKYLYQTIIDVIIAL